jgi:hypothetical protein
MNAISKFNYELKFRKKEFLSNCLSKDKKLDSKLSVSDFEQVLIKFTSYLNATERGDIIKRVSLNGLVVKYVDVVNLINYEDKVVYKHPYLTHLNKLNSQKPELSGIIGNAERLSKVLDIPPIELLNYKFSEENFIKKVSKDIMGYIVLNSGEEKTEAAFEIIFHKFDNDNDNMFTVGDLCNFIAFCNIQLGDYDLRYLFEYFKPHLGRIDRKHLFSVIFENSQSEFSKLANTDFSPDIKKLIKEDEMKEEKHLTMIILNNKFIATVYDSLQLLGKIALLKYFSKNLEIRNNKFFIDSLHLEFGYERLGYTSLTDEDVNNFKFFCVKKGFGVLTQKNTVNIDIESLFDFVTNYFQVNPNIVKKDSDSLINLLSKKLFSDISTQFLSYTIPHNENIFLQNNSEIDFRRRFMNSFGFLDHTFIDSLMNMNQDENLENEEFKIGQMSSRKWVEFSFNLLFMGMIKYHDQVGLSIDEGDQIALEQVYNKLEKKYFKIPTKQKTIKLSKGSEIIVDNKQKIELDLKVKKDNLIKTDDNTGNIKLFEFKNINEIKAIRDRKNAPNDPLTSDYKSKKESNVCINKTEPSTNVHDTVTFLPILYNKCVDYLKVKYDLAEIDTASLKNLGICSIFRDHYSVNKYNINIKEDIVFTDFVNILKDLLGNCDLFKFLCHFSSTLKSDKDQINILYFLFKVEEILLQYSKIIK